MPGPWKEWKSKNSFPTLSTVPWKSRRKREISTFPPPSFAALGKWKTKSRFPTFPQPLATMTPALAQKTKKPKNQKTKERKSAAARPPHFPICLRLQRNRFHAHRSIRKCSAHGKMESMLTRRSILLGGLAGLAACTRPKAKGFSGYAFIANQEGGAVAAVDLEVFAVARHIHVDGAPTAVMARPETGRVYALTPANGTVHEIHSANLTLAGRLQVAHSALTMRLAGRALYVLCSEPKQLVRLALDPMRIDWTLPLPADPVDLEI